MNWKADWVKYRLIFNFEARTSRQVMTYKDTYFVRIRDLDSPENFGIGEVNLFKGLSADDTPDFERKLTRACQLEPEGQKGYREVKSSAINFGFEAARLNLVGKICPERYPMLFNTDWAQGKASIKINGLVWMGDQATMAKRIEEKLNQGYACVKLKIGGIDFDQELALLDSIRHRYSSQEIELRLDANGAFRPNEALEKLKRLSAYDIHSIEQPIRAGQWEAMARLCEESPIPIALDEELIGVRSLREKKSLLSTIQPAYIILKPALCGGFEDSLDWIEAANNLDIDWWVTSALESNVGLASIAQWTFGWENPLPQGLGTGMLYINNIPAPLYIKEAGLWCDPSKKFDYGVIGFPD